MGFLEKTKKLLRQTSDELQQRYSSPEAVLERYIGELTNNLESARAALQALRIDTDRIVNRVSELKADETMWEQKARAALAKLKDTELAREALRRKAVVVAQYNELGQIVKDHKRDIRVMEKSLEPLERKILDANSKKERLTARRASSAARAEVKARLDDSGIGDFKEVEQQLLELEAEADTLSDLKLLSVSDSSRPMPEVETEIERDLERLRREVEGKGK